MNSNETVVIDIAARFTDQTSGGVKKASQEMDKFSQSVEKTKKQAQSLSKSKWQVNIEAKDKAIATINKIKNAAIGITKKAWQVTVSVVDKATAPLRKLKDFVFSLNGLLTGLAVGFLGQQLLAKPIGLADQIEASKIFFEKKLGGKEQSDIMIKDIFKFDEKSPFDTMEIIQIVQSMMGVGWKRNSVLNDLGIIGDAVAAMGMGTDGVEAITRQLGQIKSKGKAQGEELMVLQERGLPVNEWLMKGFKTNTAGLQKMKDSKTGLDGQKAVDYILAGMAKDYKGAASANADRTVKGIIDQVKSYITSKVALPWGEGLAEGLKKGLNVFKGYMDKYGDKIVGWGQQLKGVGEQFSTYMADKFTALADRLDQVINSDKFKSATWQEKFKIVWDEVIAKPFSEWWEGPGGQAFKVKAVSIGLEIGKGLAIGIREALKDTLTPNFFKGQNQDGTLNSGYVRTYDSFRGTVIKEDPYKNNIPTKINFLDPNSSSYFNNQSNNSLIPKPFANGDILSKPHVGLVAEAGPEAIIPLSSSRRGRGLELWQKAGRMLGVQPYAGGGIVGDGDGSAGGSSGIVIQLGGMHFQISGAGDAESLMAIIKEKMPQIANEVAAEIAKQISKIYNNMPVGVEVV